MNIHAAINHYKMDNDQIVVMLICIAASCIGSSACLIIGSFIGRLFA